jgi:hypothetical protein
MDRRPEPFSSQQRIEPVIARIVIVTAAMRLPAVWCFCLSLSLHALTLSIPSWKPLWWLVPAAAACGAAWMLVFLNVLPKMIPTELSLDEVLRHLGVLQQGRRSVGATALAMMPFALVGLPLWPGALGGLFCVIGVGAYSVAGQAGVAKTAITLIVVGLLISVVAFISVPAVSITCAVLVVLALLIVAVTTSVANPTLRHGLRPESASAVVGLLMLPILAVLGGSSRFSQSTLLLLAVPVPALALLGFYMAQRHQVNKARKLAVAMRTALEAFDDLKRCEDVIRESDGLFRICQPAYSHADAGRVGESGYFAWPDHIKQAWPEEEGEWVLVRGLTSVPHPLLHCQDDTGIRLRQLVESMIRGVGHVVQGEEVNRFLADVLRPWHARAYTGKERVYFKMPWDSGEVLAVRCHFDLTAVFPVGCGIHDSNKLPCHVNALGVQLRLLPSLVAAIQDCATQSVTGPELDSPLSLSSRLVWSFPLIIPSVYETALDQLVREVAQIDAFDGIDKNALVAQLQARLDRSLPSPIRELVGVTISSIDITQSALSEEDRRVHRQFADYQRTLPNMRFSFADKLLLMVRVERLYRDNKFVMKGQIRESFASVTRQVDQGMTSVSNAIASGMKNRDGEVSVNLNEKAEQARSQLNSDRNDLVKLLHEQTERVVHALDEIENAFSSSALAAPPSTP